MEFMGRLPAEPIKQQPPATNKGLLPPGPARVNPVTIAARPSCWWCGWWCGWRCRSWSSGWLPETVCSYVDLTYNQSLTGVIHGW